MVNMNYSTKELASAKKIARERGQELIVVPPEENNADAEQVGVLRERLEAKIKKARPNWSEIEIFQAMLGIQRAGMNWEGDESLKSNLYSDIKAFLTVSERVSQRELKELGSIDEQIRAKLKEMKKENKEIDTLIISAHSEGSALSGETSYNLTPSDIYFLSKDHPEFFQKARHVLLLGCYTMTDSARVYWRNDVFPNASLIAGFSPKAPLRSNPLSSKFIEDVLRTADSLDQKMVETNNVLSKNFINAAFRALRSVTGTSYNPVIDYCTTVLLGNPKAEKNVSCEDQWRVFYNEAKKIQDEYLDLESPTMDPPHQTQGTYLRAFYNSLQTLCSPDKLEYASEQEKEDNIRYRDATIANTIRLIFWWNIQKNFGLYYKNEIRELKLALSELNIDSNIPALDGTASRVEFVKKIYSIRKELRQREREMRISYGYQWKSTMDALPLLQAQRLLSKLDPIYELNDDIPLSWHSANAVLHSKGNE